MRSLLLAASLAGAAAFTCTGFDPIYDPVAKQERYRQEVAVRKPRQTDANVQELVNEGLRRYLAAIEEEQSLPISARRLQSGSGVNILQPFRLDKVSVTPGSLLQRKQATDLEYLVWLDPDSILYNFRNTSGSPLNGAQPFGGWEAPDCNLRGHFSGHWLSASAMMYNATGNATLLAHAQYVVSELGKVAAALSGVAPVPGYLSGFPVDQFIELENLVPYPIQWSPYYTIHKIAAGLRDQYLYTGNTQALSLLEGMASYFYTRVQAVIANATISKWYAIMNQEFGGMNEVLYDLYEITGNTSYADFAHLFDKPCFLGPLALSADPLDTMHANAHLPIVIGAARRYETQNGAGSSVIYSEAAMAMHEILTHDHSYATGNGNHGEYWGVPHRLGDTLDGDTQETCSSYNLLKLGRHVFAWTADVSYADHYERLLTNGILSTQQTGVMGSMIYMLPLSTVNGTAKGWGDPIYTMTCCYGSGVENWAKIADSIYFRADIPSSSPTSSSSSSSAHLGSSSSGAGASSGALPAPPQLYVIQYHSSSLVWDNLAAGASWPAGASLSLTQSAQWGDAVTDPSAGAAPGMLRSNITITGINGNTTLPATLTFRVPSWAAATGCSITVNGAPVPGVLSPLSWASVTRSWAAGDRVVLAFPFAPLRLEYINDDRVQYDTTAAVMSGPFLLVAPSQVGSALYNNPANISAWIAPLTAADRNLTSLVAGGGGPGMYIRHDSSLPAMNVRVDTINNASGTDGPDSSWVLRQPGLSGAAGTVSIESANYPGFYLCTTGTATGSAVKLMNMDVTNSGYNAACSYTLHAPGLTGVAGSVSFELSATPNAYLSWYGGGNGLTVQPLQQGSTQYANMSSWGAGAGAAATWAVPAFAYRAHASAAARGAGPSVGRDYLLYPIHEVTTETYVSYFQVADYSS